MPQLDSQRSDQCYVVFHLNLMFSSLRIAQRELVIDHCYTPLLELAERGVPLGIECPSYTLREIARLRPDWLARLNACIEARQVEFVGSGYTQLIGPLVPWQINQLNQQFGRQDYEEMLEQPPHVALVNEMAYSRGLVDLYAEAGYKGLIVDACNAAPEALSHGRRCPVWVRGTRTELALLWADAVMFQKLQRYVHGDISKTLFEDYIKGVADDWLAAVPLYAGDAEAFGYRPKRFHYETDPGPGEWRRLREALLRAAELLDRHLVLPGEALASIDRDAPVVTYADANQPIPVKKQPKYQVTRWAVTGRDDLWLNTRCFAEFRHLLQSPATQEDWRRLCYLWSSDFRTHIRKERFEDMLGQWSEREPHEAPTLLKEVAEDKLPVSGFEVARDTENLLLRVHTEAVQIVLNLRRGLAVERLAFRSGGFRPVMGTLHQGMFRDIAWSADFYSGTWVQESHQPLRRLTDLERVYPTWYRDEQGALVLAFEMETAQGIYEKRLYIGPDESVRWTFRFLGWQRTAGSLRVGHFTLLPEGWPHDLQVMAHNGGRDLDVFTLDREVSQTEPVSMLISNRGGFGATAGKLGFSDLHKSLWFSWRPDRCAALPMLRHQRFDANHFTRLVFSLCESDETFRDGGRLMDFEVTVSPHEPKSAFKDEEVTF